MEYLITRNANQLEWLLAMTIEQQYLPLPTVFSSHPCVKNSMHYKMHYDIITCIRIL